MKKVSLSGSERKNVGKKDAKVLRRDGKVPAVLYGGKSQMHFHISELDAKKIVYTPEVYMIDLDVEGKKLKAIVQEVQMHPVTDRVIHIDFLEVFANKEIKVSLPLRTTGFSAGVRNGGNLRQRARTVSVLGMEDKLPDAIEVDITSLKIGGKIRISDLNVEGLTFLDKPSSVIIAVLMARGVEETEEDEETEEGEESSTSEAPSEEKSE